MNQDFPIWSPHLKQALSEGLEFTNLHEYPGTNWTMGGIFASQCGMPLAVRENDPMYLHQAINNVVCLGDILQKAGYDQIYMGGADLGFAGKGNFYSTHGYQQVLGYHELIQDLTYRTGWGLYDDTLFELAAKQFKTLATKDKRFNLTLLTLDTHHPYGDASKSCPSYPHSENTMLQAVHCTDFLFGQFLTTIQAAPHYNDTVIFVMSDHLAMSNAATHLYPQDRKLLAFALNTRLSGKIDMAGAHVDLAQTMLDLLGIKTNAVFMFGQSLLQIEQAERLALFTNDKYTLLRSFLELANSQQKQINLCAHDGIAADNPATSTMQFGGQQIIMSADGWPTLPIDQIFVVKSNIAGDILDYRLMTPEETVRTIESEPDALYFLLTEKAPMPFGFGPSDQTYGWRWYFGNPSSLNGSTGLVEDFRQITIPRDQCQQTIAYNQESSASVFALRQDIQRLHEHRQRLQESLTQYIGVYSRSYPSTIEIVSQGTANAESYIAIDQAKLRASKGVTTVVINPLKNRIIHFQSYNTIDVPETVKELPAILNQVKKNDIVILFTHGDAELPQSVIKILENLGARQARSVSKGQPYLFLIKVGKDVIAEKVGEPGTSVGTFFDINDGPKDSERIKTLWNEHVLTIQSASYQEGNGKSFVRLDQEVIIHGRRGMNVLVLDPITRAVKAWGKFDTFAKASALHDLSMLLHQLESEDVLIVMAHDSVIGGSTGDRLPESLIADFRALGAIYPGEIRYRNPYIFIAKIGSDFRIEKFIAAEGTIQVDLTPQDVEALFPGHPLTEHSLKSIE